MARLRWMDEQRRRSRGGERRGDLARHMSGFAHAGDGEAAFGLADQLHSLGEVGAEACLQCFQPPDLHGKDGSGDFKRIGHKSLIPQKLASAAGPVH